MLKVLFAASELTPIAKVGGLGDVAGALPKALRNLGVDIRIVIPQYRAISTPSKLPGSQVPVYYAKPGKYFDRDLIYGYPDDVERFTYFNKAVLELAKAEQFEPDIIHLNDYHTSLIPTLLKTRYASDPFFAQTRTLLTIHNLVNQGVADQDVLQTVGLNGSSTPNLGWDTRDGDVDLLLQGISEADLVVAVSPTYAKEILTPEYGAGLEGKLAERHGDLFGILNGIDTDSYNPATDPNIEVRYSLANLERRASNKHSLVQDLGFSNPEYPVMGMVSRLVEQKGLDLISEITKDLGKLPINMIFLGVGDKKYEQALSQAAQSYSNIKVRLKFDEAQARKIYAGSDFFLVPSRFEPSGLTQMIAMRYGSIPLVRKTGGLADTVFDNETGLVFEGYRSSQLLGVVQRAVQLFGDPKEVKRLQINGMKRDFSWSRSAQDYVNLYQRALKMPRKKL